MNIVKSRPERRPINLRLGGWSQLFAPGYGRCRRCKTPWRFVREHATTYWRGPNLGIDPDVVIPSSTLGVFALCEKCWTELQPLDRLPYYRRVYLDWTDRGTPMDDGVDSWPLIRDAVLAGG